MPGLHFTIFKPDESGYSTNKFSSKPDLSGFYAVCNPGIYAGVCKRDELRIYLLPTIDSEEPQIFNSLYIIILN